jgi:hypothetical protein
MMEKITEDKHNKFYNGTTPWSPPPNADDSILHTTAKQIESPLVHSFTGKLDIINASALYP